MMQEKIIFYPESVDLSSMEESSYLHYKVIGDYCICSGEIRGISNSAKFSFSLPLVAVERHVENIGRVINNGVKTYVVSMLEIKEGTNIATIHLNGERWSIGLLAKFKRLD